METIFAILTVIVYILLALVGLVALTICVFLWMVSTRTCLLYTSDAADD